MENIITNHSGALVTYNGNIALVWVLCGTPDSLLSEARSTILRIRTSGYNVAICLPEKPTNKAAIVLPALERVDLKVITNDLQAARNRAELVVQQRLAGHQNAFIAEAWLIVHINNIISKIKFPSFGCIKNALKQAANGAKSFALSQRGDERRVGLKLAKGLSQVGFASKHFQDIKDAWKAWKADQKVVKNLITTPIEDLVDENTLLILKKIKQDEF